MRKMKDSGVEWIDTIPENWKVVPMKALFSFGKGLPITKDNLTEAGIPVISYGQIHARWNSGVTTHKDLFRFVDAFYLETNAQSLVKKVILSWPTPPKTGKAAVIVPILILTMLYLLDITL